ncbi:MAG: hypothetical protein ACYTKD_29470 [Planctomycetota bacterium]|jgi:hypothetical protein
MSAKHAALFAAVLSLSCAPRDGATARPGPTATDAGRARGAASDAGTAEAGPEGGEVSDAARSDPPPVEPAKPEGVTITSPANGSHLIENAHLGREFDICDGILRTTAVINKRAGTRAVPTSCDEFRLRISKGTHTTGTDVVLTSTDFRTVAAEVYEPEVGAHARENQAPAKGLAFVLGNAERGLTVEVRYEVAPDDFYMRKRLVVTSAKPVTLERIDVDSVAFEDAEQPYTVKAIYARGKWSPGLGQPLYTTKSATFWGVEFPAADNHVEGDGDVKTLRCGYLWGREIAAGARYMNPS